MPAKRRRKDKDKELIEISEDSRSPVRKSERKTSKPKKYGVEKETTSKKDEMVTPEKVPVEAVTPRKSRRSKDMSPPPLPHRQNRMPEQVELIKGDSKCFFFSRAL